MKYISWLERSNEAMIATQAVHTRENSAFARVSLTRRPCNEPSIAEFHCGVFQIRVFPFLFVVARLSFRVVWNNDDRLLPSTRNHPSVRATMLNRSKRAMMINRIFASSLLRSSCLKKGTPGVLSFRPITVLPGHGTMLERKYPLLNATDFGRQPPPQQRPFHFSALPYCSIQRVRY